MALMQGIRCFAQHQIFSHRMGNSAWQSAPRFLFNWLLLMAVQCLLEVPAWRARMQAQRAAAGRTQEALPRSSSKAGPSDQQAAEPATEIAGDAKCTVQRSGHAGQASAATATDANASGSATSAPHAAQPLSLAERCFGPPVASRVQLTPEQAAAARAIVDQTRGQGYMSLRHARMSKVGALSWPALIA